MDKLVKGLVSIVTPCYNGEKLIYRLLDSVLRQDYPNVEMFVVDDGSTDATKNVIEKYIEQFRIKGYALTYLYQDNAGQAAAINKALPLVRGEYMIWPDADDFYSSEQALSIFVRTFETLDDSYAILRCWESLVSEKDMSLITINKFNIHKEHIFEEYFTGKESIAVAGTHMVRMKHFDVVNPQRHIFDTLRPQNFQMLLPLCYSFNIFTIPQDLYTILVRQDSHSRSSKTYEQQCEAFDSYHEILMKTLASMAKMSDDDKEHFTRLSYIHCLTDKLVFALRAGKSCESKAIALELSSMGVKQTAVGKIRLLLVSIPPLLKLFEKVVNKLR